MRYKGHLARRGSSVLALGLLSLTIAFGQDEEFTSRFRKGTEALRAGDLVGGRKSPRDAMGATVYVTAGGMRQRGDVMSGGSYASSHDQRVCFGLGDAAAVDAVEIRWPSGAVERITVPSVDRFYAIEEGQGIVPSVYDPRPQNRTTPAPPRAEGK